MDQEQRARQDTWQRELYRLLVENTKDCAILIADPAGDVIAWGRGATEVLGFTEEEILGKPLELIYTPEDVRAGVLADEMKTAQARGRAVNERWQLRKNGSRVWCSGLMTPLRDEANNLRGFAKVVRDRTEGHLADLALRESEQRLRVALDAAKMGTWLWNIAEDKETLDASLKRLMGAAPDSEVRTLEDFIQLIHPDDQAAVRGAFQAALREGTELTVEFRVVGPDRSVRWLRDQGTILRDARESPVAMTGACVDITERKLLEEALQHRAEQLAEADRQKDEFLAMLGHELRNPLAPVRSLMEVLRQKPCDAERLEKAYAIIDRQVEHLVRLVDDLLDVSRITRGMIQLHKEKAELAAIVGQAVETVRPLVEARNLELMISLPMKPVHLEVDATRMTQVITNLLHNAVKYTEPGGRIWVMGERTGDGLEVRIRDTGHGIPPDLLPKLFDLFTQGDRALDRSQGGLGLGLTLVRRLVEMHGGTVRAVSDGPGRGSEFIVRLPAEALAASAGGAETPFAALPQARPGPASPRRILVVEDNPDVAESLVMLLQALGHDVAMARSGPEALEAAPAFLPDVVLLDIGLPGMDGYEVARQLRRRPELERALLVALSGYGQDEDRRRSRAAGFDHHLVKPVSRAVLQPLIASGQRRLAQNVS
ncbi:hybrid sensor histidine kinase/response regulator [Sorangium sp. So ce341]|uniref:PAS domain-containing hybrid sensor histidine kinase/response regulator n=1 Tax=Sorangium sp. So ce341 TaxID=3133302 RepID=UPI003F645136